MIKAFWAEFVAATGIDGDYEAWAFADSIPSPGYRTGSAGS